MEEREIRELAKLFDEISEETFFKRCSFKESCKGCVNKKCVANANIGFWLRQYEKTILKRLNYDRISKI